MNRITIVAKSSFRGGFLLFLGMTSSTIIMSLTTIIVARLLGPDDFGLYTIILTVPSFLVAFTDFGISPALTRFTASLHEEGEDRKVAKLIKMGLFFKFLFTLSISFLLIIISNFVAIHLLERQEISPHIRLASFYLIGQALFTSISSTFIGLDQTGKSSLLLNIQSIARAVISPALIIFGWGIAGAIMGTSVGFLIATVLGAGILLLYTSKNLETLDRNIETIRISEGLKMMVHYGAPLYLSSLITSLQVQIRNILLAIFTPNVSVGNFATALYFTVLVTVLASPIASTLFPAFSKLDIKKHRTDLDKMFKISVKYTALTIIPTSLALATLSKYIVHILYGPQYQTAPFFLSLYILNFLNTGLGMYVVEALFNSQGETRTTFHMNLITLAISIPLASILIPIYGVPGLIISILSSRFCSAAFGLFQVHQKYKISIEFSSSIKTLMTSIISALLVYIILYLAPQTNSVINLTFGGLFFISSFLVLAPVLGAIKMEDLYNLDSLSSELRILYPVLKRILQLEKKIIELSSSVISRNNISE